MEYHCFSPFHFHPCLKKILAVKMPYKYMVSVTKVAEEDVGNEEIELEWMVDQGGREQMLNF